MADAGLLPDDVDVPAATDGVPPWEDTPWLADADAWISASCEEAGLVRTGPGLMRCRIWSIVAQVPVQGGQVWFKVNPPLGGFEPAFIAALHEWSPQDAPPVLAVDTERSWSLTEHVGSRLDQLLKADPDIRHLHTPLRRFAHLQHRIGRLDSWTDTLLELGIPDGRPHALPALLESVLSSAPRGMLSREALDLVKFWMPSVQKDAEELAAFGIPDSVDHEDLHPGNIFGTVEDSRPFDWGDSVIGHPFASLFVATRALKSFLDLPLDEVNAGQLREVYLEPWREDGTWSASDLARAVDLAFRVTPILRTHTWLRVFPAFRSCEKAWSNVERWLGALGTEDPLRWGM